MIMSILSIASIIARIANLDPFILDVYRGWPLPVLGITEFIAPVFEIMFLYLPAIILLAAALVEKRPIAS